jgi:transaldolase
MKDPNILEDLVAVSPGMEIWWDSSPVIFDNWKTKMLAKADPADHEVLKAQFARMYNLDDPMSQLFRGVTTNPPLSLAAFKDDPERWQKIAQDMLAKDPSLDTEGLFWTLYLEVVKQGSDMFLPLFEASGHKEGFLSGQCDPRSAFDAEAMLAQAHTIHAMNPNVMVKVPGTAQGYEVIEQLTAEGIATNNTLTFVLSQLMDCAKSVMRGLEKAKANGVDLSNWRSVITHMEARYGDLGDLRGAGKEVGVEVSEGDVRLAELAIFKKAYRTINERGYQSKMLSCSLRVGPTIDGKLQLWHIEEKAGASAVVTCPPSFIDECINFPEPQNLKFEANRIDVDPPAEVMEKLLKIPYFARAYDEDGYTRDEYNTHPALMKTAEAFSKATQEMVDFASSCLAPAAS